MKQPTPPPSKLFIRSEVLAVVEFLTVMGAPSKQDKARQIKRLSQIEDRKTVLDILLKELNRAGSTENLQAVSELLMELGGIETLHDPLWTLIRDADTRDEVKDAANLILRHLGDESDPDLYLEYLEDPQGLINRETERMLEVAARNPEALIDFIDFIFSLPIEEQCNLLASLQADYPPEYLLNIYVPTFLAEPPRAVQEMILKHLGQIRAKRAALFLHDLLDYCSEDEALLKSVQRAISKQRLAGLYKEELFEAYREELAEPHPLARSSTLHKCFVTLPDGIGNQGIMVSVRRDNGDIAMMSVAVNDLHGIIDCFGFFQLSETDFNKIAEKFHEECAKIDAPAAYCLQKLETAEALNLANRNRLPYEYSCWKVLLGGFPHEPIDVVERCREWANPRWALESGNLYQHPDFRTWFLEEGDHPVVTEVLQELTRETLAAVSESKPPEAYLKIAEACGHVLLRALFTTEWRNIIIRRLADAAYLFHCQDTKTFCALAATEVLKLVTTPDTEDRDEGLLLSTGFIRQFGRRCMEEQLLRLRQSGELPEGAGPLIDYVLAAWEIA